MVPHCWIFFDLCRFHVAIQLSCPKRALLVNFVESSHAFEARSSDPIFWARSRKLKCCNPVEDYTLPGMVPVDCESVRKIYLVGHKLVFFT